MASCRTHLSFVSSMSPYYHALNSCFLRKFGSLSGCTQAAANSELPRPQLSAGEMKFETATPRPGRDRGAGGPKQFIYLLGFSVPQCLRGAKVLFLVAASSRRDSVVLRSCFCFYQFRMPCAWDGASLSCPHRASVPADLTRLFR